jgi:Outer membrane protein beta-barrel domain
MMKGFFLCSLAMLSSVIVALAQNTGQGASDNISCTQRLRLARATYEAGRLHELVGTILGDDAASCFGTGINAFSKQEKVDALKLKTLAYIYLEEPLEADKFMLQLLQTDHFYKPDPVTDPAEYMALFSTFRTDPIISFGGKVGGSMTMPGIIQTVPAAQIGGNGKYKPGVSFIGGFFAEKELFPRSKSDLLKNTLVLGEIFYHLRPFKIDNPELLKNARTLNPAAAFSGKSLSQWLDLNIMLRYRLKPKSNFDWYVGAGPGLSYLLSYRVDLGQTPRFNAADNISGTVTGAAVDASNSFNKIAQTVTALGGLKFRFGEIYINAEGRYQFGLFNLVNNKNRFREDLALKYGVTFNDYRQSNVILNIGVTYPYFKPKKIKRRK